MLRISSWSENGTRKRSSLQRISRSSTDSAGLSGFTQTVMGLPAARARFGKYLAVAVNGKAPPVADVIRTWPARKLATDQGETQQGLAIRLQLHREAVQAELDLGDAARFWPSDEALARWRTLAHEGRAAVVYE